jgi:hypothetical protein
MSAFYYVTTLVVGIICAIACYVIADNKGRSVILWPILGFFFPIIGLIIVLVLPRRSSY